MTRSVGANLEKILDVHFSLLADARELEYSVEVQLTERTQVEVTVRSWTFRRHSPDGLQNHSVDFLSTLEILI